MRRDKKVALLSALFGTSAVVISCGGGGGGGISTTTTGTNATTSENQTQEVQRAEVVGNVPAGLTVDNQTADITPDKAFRADGEVVTDVWAVVGNETYGGHFENRNGTWVFVIDEQIPANESFSIMFVNGTPDNPDNQTVVAVTPPIVVNATNANLKLTDVQDGVVNIDTANSVGVGQVVDNATVIEQIKQAVGKKVTEAKQVIANATQQVTEQIQQQQNATNATQEVTLKEGWYKNYAVGLYQKQVSTELKDNNNSIPAKKLAVAEKNGTFYVLVDKDGNSVYDVLYKVDSKGALSNVKDIANSTSGYVNKVVGNYIVLENDILKQYSFVKLDGSEIVNATLKGNLHDDADNVYWGLKAKDNSTIVRFDFNKGDAVLTKQYTSSINSYNNTLIQVKAASADTAWILLPSNSTSNSTVARVYVDNNDLTPKTVDIPNTTNATVADFGVASDNVAWAVLDNATANATIARIAWGGTNLTQNATTVKANNATRVAIIEPVDENIAWAVVSNATKSVVARVEYTDNGLNVSENATINGVNATNAKIVAVDKNNAWIVLSNATATYVAKATYNTDSGNVEVYNATSSIPVSNATISAKAVGLGDVLWVALYNSANNAVVRAEFDSDNNNVNLVNSTNIQTGDSSPIGTLTILETIPGKDKNYVILGDKNKNAKNTVVVYYDSENNALKTYPVDKGVQTIHSAVYVNGYTQILVNDDYNGGQLKVLTFDADNQRWTTEDSLDRDKPFSSLKKVDSTTFLGAVGSKTYLIKYENKQIQVSTEDVPCPVNVGQQICVENKDKQEEIYYLTYDNIDQWGNLALQVKEDASNSTADVKTAILNDTIYTFTAGGTKLDLIQIGAENKEDAVGVNKYEFNNDLKEVVVLPNKNLVAAVDDNGDVIIAPVEGKGAKTVSNLDVGRIATDGEFVYAITTDTLYKIDTDKAEVVNGVGTKVTDNVFTDLKDIAVVNNAIAVVGVSTGGKLGVRFINPADTSALSDWITVCDYDSNKGIYLSVKGNYLIIDHNGEAYIVDVNDRTNPQLLNATINGVDKLSVFGNIGYGMTADNKIAKIDLSNITNATIVNNATIDNYTTLVLSNAKLYAYGDYVFANDGGQRVEIYNLAGVTNNSTTVKYMGDAEVDKTISSFTVKLVNGTYYLIVTDGNRLDILKLNPKEVQ